MTKTKTIYKGKKPWPGRTYREQCGNYPSVTSIIHPEGLDFSPELLKQYASRGTIVHKQVEHYLRTGEVVSAQECGLDKDYEIVRDGSLKLSIENCRFKEFFKVYGEFIEPRYIEKKLKNKTHRFAGRADIIGKYKGEWAIMDVKTASSYEPSKMTDYWMQLAAYAHCVKPALKKMVIIPINPTAPKGYMEPLVETDVEHYFNLFLEKLKYAQEHYQLPTV